MTFSASETAFDGFRLIGREPRAFLTWGAVSAAFSLVMFGVMWATGAQTFFTELSAAGASGDLGSYPSALFGFAAISLILALFIYAVVICGSYRAVLRPEEKGFAYLRLGADEGRMALLLLIMGLLWLAAIIVLCVVLVMFSVVVGLGAASGRGGVENPTSGALMVVLLTYLMVLVFGAWFSVQFSMAAPMTFAERRLAVFRSTRLVKGNFWKLFGCFLLLGVISCLLYVVVGSLQLALNLAVGGPNPYASLMHPGEPPDLSRMFTPQAIAVSVFIQFLSVLFYPIWFAPQASAYQQLSGNVGEAKAADVFG